MSFNLEGVLNSLGKEQLQKRQMIIEYLLINRNPFFRTQNYMISSLGISQATLVRYISELKGEGVVQEKPFGTAVIYEIPYDIAIARGHAEKYAIFDLENLKNVNGYNANGWTGKVYDFGDVIFITARYESGFSMTIPIDNKDMKELIKATALGMNFGILIDAIARALQINR